MCAREDIRSEAPYMDDVGDGNGDEVAEEEEENTESMEERMLEDIEGER